MKLKKVLCIALVLALALVVFAGCNKDGNNTPKPDDGNNKVVDPNKTPDNSNKNNIVVTRDPNSTPGPDSQKVTPAPTESATTEATDEVSPEATDEGSGN